MRSAVMCTPCLNTPGRVTVSKHPLTAGRATRSCLQLHEVFLLFLWREIGLHRDDYGSAIALLCESGILFESSSFGEFKHAFGSACYRTHI